MSYLILFVAVWWKSDVWWAIAACAAANIVAPWHPSHFEPADAAGGGGEDDHGT